MKPSGTPCDTFDIALLRSPMARIMIAEPKPSAQRQQRLAEIRRQIEAGTYETPEKLEAAVDAMLANLHNPHDQPTPSAPKKPR